MKDLQSLDSPLYYAVIYITPPSDLEKQELNFKEKSSMLIAMAGTELGYSGLETEKTADRRIACICYWDSYESLSRWTEKAKRFLLSTEIELNTLLCTTGCLWPWLIENRKFSLDNKNRKAA
jgi:hypothetical protein